MGESFFSVFAGLLIWFLPDAPISLWGGSLWGCLGLVGGVWECGLGVFGLGPVSAWCSVGVGPGCWRGGLMLCGGGCCGLRCVCVSGYVAVMCISCVGDVPVVVLWCVCGCVYVGVFSCHA